MPSDVQDLRLPTDLLGITVGNFQANRRDKNIAAGLAPACHKVRIQLSTGPPTKGFQLPPGLTLIKREDFTKIFLEKLGDPQVADVRLVTYTAEVDAGDINRFKVKGKKRFEVFKRSIVLDLAEQQECNLRRIATGAQVRLWKKRKVSRRASEDLIRNMPSGSEFVQRFYYAAPSKRIYMFDDDEAILAYYEVVPDPITSDGSVYKGIVSAPALRVKRESPLTSYLLDEVTHFLAGLRRTSRTWEEERSILDGGEWRGEGRRPCIKPQAVLLDLDGVLYNSLPLYVRAWQEAFAVVGLDFPESKVYAEEGRRGVETIRTYFEELDRPISESEVARIQAKKKDVFLRLGPPKVQSGAQELVREIQRQGLEIWVVTGSSNEQHLEGISVDFAGLIRPDHVISGRDVEKSKPSPDPYRLCCELAGCHPHNAIVIENAPLGVKAADAAGTFCIGVNTGILADSQLIDEGARAVFESCELLARQWKEVIEILKS